MKPITAHMLLVLRQLAGIGARLTPSQIAQACGFRTGQDRNRCAHNGRTMSPAQRVIFPLIGLRERGLVRMTSRPDGLSGTAYEITKAGENYLWDHDE